MLDGTEYGQPYCRFGFPVDLSAKCRIVFEKNSNGGVTASLISCHNDPHMNQQFKFHLQSWMENCDLQVVLDEEQYIRYLVKYASKQ